jgi:Tfp pilus assembly protein PilF
MARAYERLKKFDEAIAGYTRVMQLDPRDPKPYVNLGEIYCETKDFDQAIVNLEKAIAEAKKAIEQDPKNINAHLHLSNLYVLKKDFAQAEKH